MLAFKQRALNESYQKQTRAEAAHGYLSGISSDSRRDNASSDKYNARFQYNANVPRNIALPQSLTPPDVVELREAVEEEMLFGDRSDTAWNKKLQILSDDLHTKELAKQTKTKITLLRKKNITPAEKMDLLLNQIQLDN